MLTDTELQHIAKLARIELKPNDSERLKKDFSSILGYFEKLNEVEIENVEPLYQTTGLVNQLRSDDVVDSLPLTEERKKSLLGQAPATEQGYLKVKQVFER